MRVSVPKMTWCVFWSGYVRYKYWEWVHPLRHPKVSKVSAHQLISVASQDSRLSDTVMLALIAVAATCGAYLRHPSPVTMAAIGAGRRAAETCGARLRHPPPAMAAIGAGRRAAEEQKAEYFAMLPWEVPTKLELPGGIKSSLDLRAFVQPFNRSCAVMSGVFVYQEGVPRSAYPQARKNAKVGWRAVGLVSALDEASLPLAIARQRGLIAAWANEYIRDYVTDAKVFDLGPDAPPIRIAFGERPNPMSLAYMMDKSYEGDLTEVPLETPVRDDVRCGFFGSQSRSQMGRLANGAQSGFRYVGIELPDE